MCSSLDKLNELTLKMVDRLSIADYEELVDFVDNREQLAGSVLKQRQEENWTKEDQALLDRILEYDQAILSRMNSLKLEAGSQIKRMNQAKMQKTGYNAPFHLPDSILMDRRN